VGDGASGRGGYRAPAPGAGAHVHWPDDFGTRFTIFVDTEEEFDWGAPLSADADGTRHMAALPPVHARFAAAGAALTYLADYPIATSRLAVEVLREVVKDGRSAIGTQLHPWVNPPHEEEVNGFNSFTGNLPLGLQRAKLAALTDAVTRIAGRQPLVYRAGRYGIGPDTPALLAELGYRIDSSMRSAYDYSGEGGPDFSAVPNHAFHLGELVELPFTTVFTGHLRRGGARLHRNLAHLPKGIGIASRLGLLSRVALTPEDMPLDEAREAVRVAVGEGLRLLNFAFHSPSVEPGHTPYVRTEADLAAFLRWWEEVLALLDKLGVRSASVDEIVAAACRPA